MDGSCPGCFSTLEEISVISSPLAVMETINASRWSIHNPVAFFISCSLFAKISSCDHCQNLTSEAMSGVGHGMLVQRFGIVADDLSGAGGFLCAAVDDHQKLPHSQRGFVAQDAVVGNAQAEKCCSQRAQATHDHRAFQCAQDPSDQGPRHHQGSDAGDEKERRTEKQAPNAAPKGAQLSPILHAVAGVVVAHHMKYWGK